MFTVFTRLFGNIVAAIALQYILEGLEDVFPGWMNASSPVDESFTINGKKFNNYIL